MRPYGILANHSRPARYLIASACLPDRHQLAPHHRIAIVTNEFPERKAITSCAGSKMCAKIPTPKPFFGLEWTRVAVGISGAGGRSLYKTYFSEAEDVIAGSGVVA